MEMNVLTFSCDLFNMNRNNKRKHSFWFVDFEAVDFIFYYFGLRKKSHIIVGGVMFARRMANDGLFFIAVEGNIPIEIQGLLYAIKSTQ